MEDTFGKIRAGIRVREILLEIQITNPSFSRKCNKKVNSMIQDSYRIVKELSFISDSKMYEMMWRPCCKDCIERIKYNSLPPDIKDHLHNVIIGIFRNARRTYLIKHKDTPKKVRARMKKAQDKHIEQYESLLKESFIDKYKSLLDH